MLFLRFLALAMGMLMLGPATSAAAGPDSVTVSGSGGFFSQVQITAQSGTAGQNPSGTAAFSLFDGGINVSGPVTCLSVSGPDSGAGTSEHPTTAVLNVQDPTFGIVTVRATDNGGNGQDIIDSNTLGRDAGDCSPMAASVFLGTLTDGRATVFDAPLLPTSKEQCKNGRWRTYGVFKNQGDCVSFVVRQAAP